MLEYVCLPLSVVPFLACTLVSVTPGSYSALSFAVLECAVGISSHHWQMTWPLRYNIHENE